MMTFFASLFLFNLVFPPTIAWEFSSVEDDLGNPQTTIYIIVNNQKTEVGKGVGNFSEIPKENFADPNYQIPAEALTACTGFWAGLAHHLYIVKKGNMLWVQEGYADENEPAGSKMVYRTIKKIKL
jgi:hypothetical protein